MTDSKKVERRGHFRGKARAGRRVELTYRPQGAPESDQKGAVTSNIGVGGAFILTDAPPPVTTRLDVALSIPTSESALVLSAEVRWVRHPKEGRTDAGMGVKFLGLDVDSLLLLSEYFASLTGDE